jgi:hypothetical protein
MTHASILTRAPSCPTITYVTQNRNNYYETCEVAKVAFKKPWNSQDVTAADLRIRARRIISLVISSLL